MKNFEVINDLVKQTKGIEAVENLVKSEKLEVRLDKALVGLINLVNEDKLEREMIKKDALLLLQTQNQLITRLGNGEIIKLRLVLDATLQEGSPRASVSYQWNKEENSLDIQKIDLKAGVALLRVNENGTYEILTVQSPDTNEEYRKLLNCRRVEFVKLGEKGLELVVDEESKYANKEITKNFQPFLPADYIMGSVLIVRRDKKTKDIISVDGDDFYNIASFINYQINEVTEEQLAQDLAKAMEKPQITVTTL